MLDVPIQLLVHLVQVHLVLVLDVLSRRHFSLREFLLEAPTWRLHVDGVDASAEVAGLLGRLLDGGSQNLGSHFERLLQLPLRCNSGCLSEAHFLLELRNAVILFVDSLLTLLFNL